MSGSQAASRPSCSKGSVYYFFEPSFVSKEPHYFVVLNDGHEHNSQVVLISATSQIEQRRDYHAKNGLPLGSLIEVDPGEYPDFKKVSAFDCNRPLIKTPRFLSKTKLLPTQLPATKVKSICMGVIASKMVEPRIKKMIQF